MNYFYFQHFFLQQFIERLSECPDPSIKLVLRNLGALYGLYSLEKFLSTLYQGGYATGNLPAVLVEDGITDLCSKLKNDAVALVDVLAPPDFILNSILGVSDGKVRTFNADESMCFLNVALIPKFSLKLEFLFYALGVRTTRRVTPKFTLWNRTTYMVERYSELEIYC